MRYYYTFGSDAHFPFQGGWVTIDADSQEKANLVFQVYYQPEQLLTDDVLNCAFCYPELEFQKTTMYKRGNLAAMSHKEISVQEDFLEIVSRLPGKLAWELSRAILPDNAGDGENKNMWWTNGLAVLCLDEELINDYADKIETNGLAADMPWLAVTGYYDPDEDERSGEKDQCTGYHYCEVY